MNQKKSPSKDIKFTTIEISEHDRQRLFECAMRIKELNGDKGEPFKPAMIAHFATDALVNEVEFWEKASAPINNLSKIDRVVDVYNKETAPSKH